MQTPTPSIAAVLVSPTGHIIAQGPLVRPYEEERNGISVVCAEVSIGGTETRKGPLVNQPS
jgi:hypothetical protein